MQFHDKMVVFLIRQTYFLLTYFSVAGSKTRSLCIAYKTACICAHLAALEDQRDQNINFKGKCRPILLKK